MMHKLRRFAINLLMPITRWIGKLHLPYTVKRIKGWHYLDAAPLLRPGVVLITKTYGQATNLLIPGEFKHAAIVGPDGNIIEASGTGVRSIDPITFFTEKDEVKLLFPKDFTEDGLLAAAHFAQSKIGCAYDYEFSSHNKAYYCSELVYLALSNSGEQCFTFTLRPRLGELSASPDDFNKAKKYFVSAWDSRKIQPPGVGRK